MSVCLSVRPPARPYAWKDSAPTGRIFIKILNLRIFPKYVEKIQVSSKSNKNDGYFT